MNQRANPFAVLDEVSAFRPRLVREKSLANDAIERIAEENNFPSRKPSKVTKEPTRKARRYRTGRNRQFNIRASVETLERFYKMADERKIPLGALLEQAVDALDKS